MRKLLMISISAIAFVLPMAHADQNCLDKVEDAAKNASPMHGAFDINANCIASSGGSDFACMVWADRGGQRARVTVHLRTADQQQCEIASVELN